MGRLNYQGLTIRKRPHFQPLKGTLFVTFRLAESIPKSTVRYYKAKRDWLKDQLRRVERISAEAQSAEHPSWLTQLEQLNSKIMHTLKGRSARECNLILERSGSFWEHESFDHVIRNGKFDKTIRYVLNNPVKIGVVRNWEDYRWNYCRKELIERFQMIRQD